MKQAVLIFAKNLIYGEVKTRLAETIGNDRAFFVYKELLQHTKEITKNIIADKIVFYSNNVEEKDIWNDETFKKYLQSGNDLGERMQNAFEYAFTNGYEEAVIIGTDCFELTSSIINDAFSFLKNYDVVIGPAKDGGYYLLGIKKLYKEIFEDKKWSDVSVFKDTINTINKLHLSNHQLETLTDVDEEKDLPEKFQKGNFNSYTALSR